MNTPHISVNEQLTSSCGMDGNCAGEVVFVGEQN